MGCILSIQDLKTSFYTRNGVVKAVEGVDLHLEEGKTFGLIGETGCGKSVLGLSVMRLLPRNARVEGKIFYRGQDLLQFSEGQMQRLRGKKIALIPQNPGSSLNPVLKIGIQIAEALQLHHRLPREQAWAKGREILSWLKLPAPENTMRVYPHQLSGGMKQRVLAAIGMTGAPDLLIADEPTKGLDAVIRSQVVAVLSQMVSQTKATLLVITHDLKVATRLCQQVAVMYAGEIVELGTAEQIFNSPRHPYTRALLAAQPVNGLKPLDGFSPSLINLPPGCKFHPRCGYAREVCRQEHPPLMETIAGNLVRCMFFDQG
ncbi:Oligopeptide transport ATP-binding protein OppD [Neomoorella glycerini]|uniref:Nickel import system ATP-binding protein NikD n=1 Tax=Neomoorella glycerini TaxID=55779 RepID=A0A6I5ZWL4_9FIRM|nr:ABC transporter ATP-binding protein [Moorella glycerini]QGP93847.1 Oligopeptide transport ATP-binding protein OppD [Moorella glycerini]